MKDQAFVRQEILDASHVDPADLRCPKCFSNTLVLSGHAEMPQREIHEDGQLVHREFNHEAQSSFDIERIDCVHCAVTYILRDPKLFALERENLNLRTELAGLRRELGETPAGGGSSSIGYLN